LKGKHTIKISWPRHFKASEFAKSALAGETAKMVMDALCLIHGNISIS
jgi:hypothetical protein